MSVLHNLFYGFGVALQPINLFACFIGVFIGTLIGVLPGIGPVGAMSVLLPATFGMSPVAAIIMLAGIYYGAMYGGSTTSILVNIPGEAASVVTCIDGYQMARQGRAGPALGHCGLRVLHRGHNRPGGTHVHGRSSRTICSQVRSSGIFFAHVPRSFPAHVPHARFDLERAPDGRRRDLLEPHRPGYRDRQGPFHLRIDRPTGRRGSRAPGHGPLWYL